jgi:hypothetical protein
MQQRLTEALVDTTLAADMVLATPSVLIRLEVIPLAVGMLVGEHQTVTVTQDKYVRKKLFEQHR